METMPSWRRSGFSPRYFEQPYLGRMPPWRHGSFSPSVQASAFIYGTRIFYSQFLIKCSLQEFSVIVSSALFFVISRMEIYHDFLLIIHARLAHVQWSCWLCASAFHMLPKLQCLSYLTSQRRMHVA